MGIDAQSYVIKKEMKLISLTKGDTQGCCIASIITFSEETGKPLPALEIAVSMDDLLTKRTAFEAELKALQILIDDFNAVG